MSTNVLLSLVLAGGWACVGAFGQATFRLQNRLLVYGVDAPVFDAQGVALAGNNYLAELYGGVTQDSLTPAVISEGHVRVMQPFLTGGYFIGTSVQIDAAPGGGWAWLQVRAWDARLGATYEDVEALDVGGYGESRLFYAQGGSQLGLPTLPGPLIGLESFSLRAVVPEPATGALLAWGGLGLWWAARRRPSSAP